MAIEVRLREPGDLPEGTELVVHYGSGLDAIDQLITNAVGNYGFYRDIAERKGTGEPGALVLSVFACTAGVTLRDLLGSAPAAPYPRYGTVAAGELYKAGWELWATDVWIDGTLVEFSHVHFDVLLRSKDVEIPEDLAALARPARRQLRELLRPHFSSLSSTSSHGRSGDPAKYHGSEVMVMERPILVASLLAVVQNKGLVSANIGTWDGEAEIHEGDLVLVSDAGAGPYEATVEGIEGSWARLRVHAFAVEKRATA